MREWFRLAVSKVIVKRALMYAVVDGAILIVINPSDALLQGKVDATQIARMILTMLVPYAVSTLSSTSATRSLQSKSEQ